MPALNAIIDANADPMAAELARSRVLVEVWSRGIQKQFSSTSPFGGRSTIFNASANKSAVQEYGQWWKGALAKQAADEVSASVDAATRANRARALLRGRAVERLDRALTVENTARSALGWFPKDEEKAALANATAARIVAQARVAALVSEAAAVSQVAGAMSRGARGVGNFKAALGEVVVILRELQRGNYSRILPSISIAFQRAGVGLIEVLTSIPGLIAVAGAAVAYFTFNHLKKLNAELDDMGKHFAKGFGDMAESARRASTEAADAMADEHAWLTKLGEAHDTVSDKLEEKLRLMREEAELRREGNPNQTKQERIESEQAERKAELEAIAAASREQKEIADRAIGAHQDALAKAFTTPEALDRNKRLGNNDKASADAAKDVEFYAAAKEAVQAQVDKQVADTHVHGGPAAVANVREHYSGYVHDGEVNGRKYSMSLADAAGQLEKSIRLQATLDAEKARLAAIQRELADNARDTKSDAETQVKERARLLREYYALDKSIKLHEKLDPAVEAEDAQKDQRVAHGGVSSLQQVGAYTSPAVTIATRSLHKLTEIHKEIVKINHRGPGREGGGAVGH